MCEQLVVNVSQELVINVPIEFANAHLVLPSGNTINVYIIPLLCGCQGIYPTGMNCEPMPAVMLCHTVLTIGTLYETIGGNG